MSYTVRAIVVDVLFDRCCRCGGCSRQGVPKGRQGRVRVCVCVGGWVGGFIVERDRDRDRDRDREIHRETQRNRHTERERERDRDRETETETDRQRDSIRWLRGM